MSYPPSYGSYPPVHTQIVTQPLPVLARPHIVIAWVVTVLHAGLHPAVGDRGDAPQDEHGDPSP